MITTDQIDPIPHANIVARLKSIEGQARGVQRMMAEQRDCHAVLDQLLALRAATHAVAMEALAVFGTQCLSQSSSEDREQVIAELFAVVSRLTR
jgi:DNA-binding FrmR family transcriptional regulator